MKTENKLSTIFGLFLVIMAAVSINVSAMPGDVNGDGTITMSDANAVVNYFLATTKPNDFDMTAGDVNGDGSITMSDANQIVNMFLSGNTGDPANGHEYVDLGLSVKWATCNVGAEHPQDYGDHFAWGETKPKSDYSWETYKYGEGSNTVTKYNDNESYGTVDKKRKLDPSDDAARAYLGGAWRMPTYDEQSELFTGCYWEWTDNYNNTNVKGFIVYKVDEANSSDKGKKKTKNGGYTPSGRYSPAGNVHIFLPAAGWRSNSSIYDVGLSGHYLSATLHSTYFAERFYFRSTGVAMNNCGRSQGHSVRAVLP